MRTSRRFHLLLPAELEADLRSFARDNGVSLARALRSLAVRALELERGEAAAAMTDSPAALAALTASEHAVLMVASVLPEGERRMHSLSQRAVEAAERRLAMFRDQAAGPEEVSG